MLAAAPAAALSQLYIIISINAEMLFLLHRSAARNKARILLLLVPVRMLLGQLPADDMLQRYGLAEYAAVKSALQASAGFVSL